MEGVDEVGAHCGLFFPGEHYERLVGDVGSRIVGWVTTTLPGGPYLRWPTSAAGRRRFTNVLPAFRAPFTDYNA